MSAWLAKLIAGELFGCTNKRVQRTVQGLTQQQDSPKPSTKVTNEWSYTSTPLYAFMAWTGKNFMWLITWLNRRDGDTNFGRLVGLRLLYTRVRSFVLKFCAYYGAVLCKCGVTVHGGGGGGGGGGNGGGDGGGGGDNDDNAENVI
jgi:uncharacterized membrane protein YgcG